MKTISMVLLSGLISFLNPQETILKIKSDFSEIKGKMNNSYYRQDISQLKNFTSILNLDVFEYYDIKNQYDTDLKRKVYMESEDYKAQFLKLEELKSQMISTTYYLDFEPEYYERNNPIKYDLNTKNFSASNEIYLNSYCDKIGYIQFDQILFKCPSCININTRNLSYDCDDFIEETISFKIDDESLGLKIEENKSNLMLLFVFSFKGTIPFQRKLPDLTQTDYYLLTEVRRVIVYDSKTNEIYFIYE
jgi:hypothetical protein